MVVFFICDVEYYSEDKDLGSAIIYFYPKEVPQSKQHVICSQIIGISKFLQVTFCGPSVVRLSTNTYVLYKTQNYILVLGSTEISSFLLKRKLKLIHSTFTFYFSSFFHILNVCNNDRDLFLKQIEIIFDHCLNIAKKNVLYATPRPSEEVLCDICTKSYELLETHKRCPNILGGAVVSMNRLLSTSLPWDVASYLLLFSHFEHCLMSDVPTSYILPSGVLLKYVYLTSEKVKDVQEGNTNCDSKFKTDLPGSHTISTIPVPDSLTQNVSYEQYSCSGNEKKKNWTSNRLKLLSYPAGSKGLSLCPVNMICIRHSLFHSALLQQNVKHSHNVVVQSTCDFEFQCFICANFSEHSRVKYWNKCFHHPKAGILELCYVNGRTSYKKFLSSNWNCKLIDFDTKLHFESIRTPQLDITSEASQSFESGESSQIIFDSKHIVEDNDIFVIPISKKEETVLYINRFKDIFVFLLLKNAPSENQLNFMWSCDSSFLANLAFQMSQECEEVSDKKRTDALFCSYHYESGIFHGSEQLNLELQSVHQDFLTDASFHSIYVGKYNKSIYACNMKKHQIFYEKKGSSNQKASWLTHLYNRAHKRAKKYLASSFPNFYS